MNAYFSSQQKLVVALNEAVGDKKLWQELTQLFGQSKAVVYKKMRCHAPFSFSELVLLAQTYGVSVDAAIGHQPEEEITDSAINSNALDFLPTINSFAALTSYLTHMQGQLSVFKDLPDCSLQYIARDIPLYENYRYPELGAFKALVWLHEVEQKSIKLKQVPAELLEAGSRVFSLQQQVTSNEIWSENTLDTTINQLAYCRQQSLINDFEVKLLIEKLYDLVDAKQHEVNISLKDAKSKNTLIVSPFIMMANASVINLGASKIAMVAISAVQTVILNDPEIISKIENSISFNVNFGKILNNSTPKEVDLFFNTLREKITAGLGHLK